MKRLHYILFFLLILTGISSCKKDPDYYHIRISGKVIDAKTSLAVAGAELHRLYYSTFGLSYSDTYTIADANGDYAFYADTDGNGDFTFVVVKPGYNAYAGCIDFHLRSKEDISNINPIIYPDTYISFVITKTTATDSSIIVKLHDQYPVNLSKTITNITSPDTLTIVASSAKNNVIKLNISRYYSNPPTGSPYSQTEFEYNIYPTLSDTTFYPVSY